jgi:hypothetical protein
MGSRATLTLLLVAIKCIYFSHLGVSFACFLWGTVPGQAVFFNRSIKSKTET